jgi:hypothetical protein
VQVDALEGEQGEEQPGLPADDGPSETARPGGDLPGGEGQDAVADVRVVLLLVRVGVVPVVLADPPAVAEPDQDVAQHLTEQVVGAAAGEHLLVPAVVAEERHLGEHDPEGNRGEHLPPRITDLPHRSPGQDVTEQGHGDADGVGRRPSVEQAGGTDPARKHRELASPPVGLDGGYGAVDEIRSS